MKMTTIACLLMFSLTIVKGVKIHELVVPSVVEEGSENVLLDCNFQYNASEAEQLEVKWYHNQDPAPFCQWIAGMGDSKPQLIGDTKFAAAVDLSYTAGSDSHTRYRALLLHRPGPALAGTYTCKVSSLESEAVARAEMMVYSPAVASEFKQKKLPGNKVNISCSFEGLYPAPVVKLTWGNFELIEDAVEISPVEGAYDVTIHKTLEHSELPAETVFGCEVTIPGTEYFLREEAMYHHRGRRSADMEKIKQLEEMRRRKSKLFSYNMDGRYNMEFQETNSLYSGAATTAASLGLLSTVAAALLC